MKTKYMTLLLGFLIASSAFAKQDTYACGDYKKLMTVDLKINANLTAQMKVSQTIGIGTYMEPVHYAGELSGRFHQIFGSNVTFVHAEGSLVAKEYPSRVVNVAMRFYLQDLSLIQTSTRPDGSTHEVRWKCRVR